MNKFFKSWHNQYIIKINQQQYEKLSVEWYQIYMKQTILEKWIEYHKMKRRFKNKKSNDKLYIYYYYYYY